MDPFADTVIHPFLVVYASCMLVTIGLRVAVPRGRTQLVAFDVPNIVSSIVLLIGAMPLVFACFTDRLQGELDDLLGTAFTLSAVSWALTYTGRYYLVDRRRF